MLYRAPVTCRGHMGENQCPLDIAQLSSQWQPTPAAKHEWPFVDKLAQLHCVRTAVPASTTWRRTAPLSPVNLCRSGSEREWNGGCFKPLGSGVVCHTAKDRETPKVCSVLYLLLICFTRPQLSWVDETLRRAEDEVLCSLQCHGVYQTTSMAGVWAENFSPDFRRLTYPVTAGFGVQISQFSWPSGRVVFRRMFFLISQSLTMALCSTFCYDIWLNNTPFSGFLLSRNLN